MIDQNANIVSLARQMRMDLDPAALKTEVQTATLITVLEWVMDFGRSDATRAVAESAGKAVREHVAKVETEQRWVKEDNNRARV